MMNLINTKPINLKQAILLLLFLLNGNLLFAQSFALKTFSKDYKGFIGKYPITMHLRNSFMRLNGYYNYNSHKNAEGIELSGSISSGQLKLQVYNDMDGKLSEEFKGTITGDSTITGMWAAGKKTLPFKLEAIKEQPDRIPAAPDFSQLVLFVDKDPWKSNFFEKPIVQEHMRKMLKNEYGEYLEFIEDAGEYPGFMKEKGLITEDFSFLHIGCISQSLFVIDEKTKGFYLCWIKDKEGVTHLYSDQPNNYVPKDVLQFFIDSLNEGWGHVYTFKIANNKIVATSKD